ncbi:GyrI-like domain-containing protein [Tessaracoccus palaemonis]|uniref:GyrI-like domain-containing protein n=1 Tax=Tessaracoccus palaemonis TaxID=2829499 RepID=A0ABX8SG08_9ACTN|nr:GyrI-like domain-containing protein [Tessaracoccus palaemonis]QXT62311.1 GyrI-like domain-containing protein [Tessaracoccus palaemonis]
MTDSAFPEAPFSAPTTIELAATPLAVVRYEGISLDGLPAAFDEGFPALGNLVGAGALDPTGPALALYRGEPEGIFDLEVGFPVSTILDGPLPAGDVSVVGSQLPAGPALATTHVGTYDGLGAAWADLTARAPALPTGVWVEVYVTDPSVAPEELRTDLILPLGD